MAEDTVEQEGSSATATCPDGYRVASGGCHCFGGVLVRSWPDLGENTWGCGCRQDGAEIKTRAYAMCVEE
jgi:hypothetical protein